MNLVPFVEFRPDCAVNGADGCINLALLRAHLCSKSGFNVLVAVYRGNKSSLMASRNPFAQMALQRLLFCPGVVLKRSDTSKSAVPSRMHSTDAYPLQPMNGIGVVGERGCAVK